MKAEPGHHHDHGHEEHDHGHSDHHNHDHGHSHGMGHSHAPKDFNRAFAVGVFLNFALVVAQVVYGLIAHSLALVADAGHNFADVLGLLLAWWAMKLAKSVPTKKHTYGLRSASILAALTNAILLLVTMGAVAWEALQRLRQPEQVDGRVVIWVSVAAILVNGISALLFFSGRKGDLNIRGAFLHLAADAGIALGVVFAGLAIVFTGKLWIDPVVSLIIVGIIVYGTWHLLKESMNMALQGVPPRIDEGAVRGYLAGLPGVVEIHDLHIWGMSTTETALTVHLVMRPARVDDGFLVKTCEELEEKFEICHSTIQIESGDPHCACELAPAERV
jgi:cobalt-zinc-cadmium efflux system protein